MTLPNSGGGFSELHFDGRFNGGAFLTSLAGLLVITGNPKDFKAGAEVVDIRTWVSGACPTTRFLKSYSEKLKLRPLRKSALDRRTTTKSSNNKTGGRRGSGFCSQGQGVAIAPPTALFTHQVRHTVRRTPLAMSLIQRT